MFPARRSLTWFSAVLKTQTSPLPSQNQLINATITGLVPSWCATIGALCSYWRQMTSLLLNNTSWSLSSWSALDQSTDTEFNSPSTHLGYSYGAICTAVSDVLIVDHLNLCLFGVCARGEERKKKAIIKYLSKRSWENWIVPPPLKTKQKKITKLKLEHGTVWGEAEK